MKKVTKLKKKKGGVVLFTESNRVREFVVRLLFRWKGILGREEAGCDASVMEAVKFLETYTLLASHHLNMIQLWKHPLRKQHS